MAFTVFSAFTLTLVLTPDAALADKVRITSLSDVNFGMIANPQVEARRSQNMCVYSNGTGMTYSVSASGTGNGASFVLTSGANSLPFQVEWSDSTGQSSGVSLSPATPLTGQRSSATQQFCNSGPATSASMIIVLRPSDLTQAREGNYAGTLNLLISAE